MDQKGIFSCVLRKNSSGFRWF